MQGQSSRKGFAFRLITTVTLCILVPMTANASEHIRPPLGLQLFCLQNKSDCRPSGDSTVLRLDETLLEMLTQVNRSVNETMIPQSDSGMDVWRIGGRYGDCEDFAMTKRHILMAQNLSGAALRIAHATTRSGEGHAILLVRTDKGDVVLDNLTTHIAPLPDTGYRISGMSSSSLLNWVAYP